MACLRSAQRSSIVAFASDAPYLAAGTMAGAVDLSFSSAASLEIFNLDFTSDSHDLPLVGSSPSRDRFHRISWSKPVPGAGDGHALGLIAGGLSDGSISVWNPRSLISSNGEEDSAVAQSLQEHTGSVRALEFNSITPNILASGADDGEIFIWNFEEPTKPSHYPSLKSAGSGGHNEISFVSWNPKNQHILASTSYSGMTVVWDLRNQKQVTSFTESNRRCSVLQWNPDMSIELVTASDEDNSPTLQVWDVRKTISPVKEFFGHTKGVIAMSWCPHDSLYLLSCAKDNRTICWYTVNGKIACELPASTNWNFDVHWHPKIPGVISASSFDAKIGIYNIESCSRLIPEEDGFGVPGHLRAPKWLKRMSGVSFGFGGKLVSFKAVPPASSSVSSTGSEVYVHSLVTENDLVNRSTEFEAAIKNMDRSSLQVLCDKKAQESVVEDERDIWGFLKVMFGEEGTARTKLLAHLGFSVPSEGNANIDVSLNTKLYSLNLDEAGSSRSPFMGGEGSASQIDNGDDFFNNPHPTENICDNAVSNGKVIQEETEEHLENTDELLDDSIQRLLVVGDYKGAVQKCISANRMPDALVIANAGGPSLWESTRDQYLRKSQSSYLKVVSALVKNDLLSLINSRPLNSWRETLAILCTFAQKEEWNILCDTLALRLMTIGKTLPATLCYICAGNIEKTVEIWSHSLRSVAEGRTYADLLQDLMEKTIILSLATGQQRFGLSLSKLVENYAELLANQGLLTTALDYLKLLGPEEPSHELSILQDRIKLSSADADAQKASVFESTVNNSYPAQQSHFGDTDNSNQYYQPQQQQSGVGNQYGESYQQTYSSYQGYPTVQPKQVHGYASSGAYPPASVPPQIFMPSQSSQIAQPFMQTSFAPAPVSTQPTARAFVPTTPSPMRNIEQYQPPSLGSQLYPGGPTMFQQPAPHAAPHASSQLGAIPSDRFRQPVVTPLVSRSFTPIPNMGGVVRPGTSPIQPSSPAHPAQAQPAAAPPPPAPTVQTVNTSSVPAELKPVVITLTRLYNEASEAAGGARAAPAKRREIEDNSRKIGELFAKLNGGDISPNAASKLIQLCQALDAQDIPTALRIQVVLTTSDWDECNFWLAALKRMIKTKQNVRT